MMSLGLRGQLHWCESAGRIVFLDVTADRYFCLPSGAKAAFLALAAGKLSAQEGAPLVMLTERGLLVKRRLGEPFPQPAQIEAPTHDLLRFPAPRGTTMAILRALAWERYAAWQLRTRPFSEAVALARRHLSRRDAPHDSGPVIRSIAAAAEAAAFVTRSHNRCLVRGFAVHAACRARGIPAKLVLGVIGHPFAAHCWVQVGDAVVIGEYEQARLHTPILVVE